MQELSKIIENRQENTAVELINWFQRRHVAIIRSKICPKADFVKEIFTYFINRPTNYEEDEWERLTLIAYIFVISLSPPPKLIPTLPFPRSYGPLVSVYLIMNSMKPPTEERHEQYVEIFQAVINRYISGFGTNHFYSRSPIYFYRLFPSYIEKYLSTRNFLPFINNFLQAVNQVKPTDLNFDFILFTSEMLNKLRSTQIFPNYKKEIEGNLLAAFSNIFELSSASSCIFLQNFFCFWLIFVMKSHSDNRENYTIFADQIEKVTLLFSQTASLKHHELHRTFTWNFCFIFYNFVNKEEHKERILSMICNGIRRVSRIDGLFKISESVTELANKFKIQYKEGNSWAMYYILASLDSTIWALISDLKRITGAASMNSTQNEKIAQHKVSFAEENGGLSPLDNELFALYPKQYFKTPEEVVPVFDRMTQFCDSVRQHLSSNVQFQLTIAKHLGGLLKEELSVNPKANVSVPLHYLLQMMRSWTELIIIASHRQNVMNTYSQRELIYSKVFPGHLSSLLENPKKLLDFAAIFRRFFLIIEEYPREFFPLFAIGIARQMFNAMKKGLLTYTFIEYFKYLSLEVQNYNQSLFFNILSRMMEIAANNTNLFLSQSTTDSSLLYSWILFTIRFGSARTNNQPNPMLGIFLKSYQKLFITAVLYNIKRIANQSIALRTVTLYLQSVKFHNQLQQEEEELKKDMPKKKGRTKPILYEEIQDSAKFEALGTLITLFIEEPNFLELQYLMPFLDATFKIGNKELIAKAAGICLKKFKIEKAKKYCDSFDHASHLFSSFFNVIPKIEFNTAKEILKIIPAYAPLYLQTPHKTFSLTRGIEIEELGFDMDLILESVTNHLSDNEEIISSLFALVTCCFEIVLNNLDLPVDFYTRTVKQLIILLCHCWCFDHLHPKIDTFASYLTISFGDAFIRGDSNVYVLCLLDVAGCSRSAIAKIAMDLSKTFFEYLRTQTFSDTIMHQTVEQFLSSFPPQTRLFSMLCGFSLMIRFFPNYIRLDHLRSFLVQTTDVSPLDLKFPRIVNRFLKEYLLTKPPTEKEPFVQMVYDIICPLSMGIRNVLMKRVSKLGLPIPVSSIDEIQQCPTQFLMIQQLTLAFLCGLLNPFEMNPALGSKVVEFMATRNGESCSLEKLSRILALIQAILKNDQVFKYFSDGGHLPSFLHFFFSSLSSRFSPINKSAKKSFIHLKDKAQNDPTFERQLQDFYQNPEKIFKFFSPFPDRINFYVRLTKIIPQKIPSSIIKLFFNAIYEYEEKKDSEKMKYLANFIKILKFFTVTEYVNQNSVRETVLSQFCESTTYLQMYIKVMVQLYEHNEIPFVTVTRKYISRFLIMFPLESIDFLMNNEHSIFSFFFIEDLIVHDKTKIFLNTFLDIFGHINDYSSHHPSLFKLVENLSRIKDIAIEPNFFKALQNNFNSLFPIISDQSHHNDNDFTLITYTANAIINVFKYKIDAKRVIGFCKVFSLNYFTRSNVYRQYVINVFRKTSQEFLEQLLELIISSLDIIKPLYLDILLPHLIKNFKGDLSFLWDLIANWLNEKENARYAFLHAIIYLLDQCKPTQRAIVTILEVMKITFPSSDINLLIYSLKIATKLSKMKLLPPEVYYSIFKQLFTYQKFSEPPYSKYLVEFLKSSPENLKQLKSNDYNFLAFYMHHRFLQPRELQKVISPINSVFLAAPELYKYLPFSLITAVATLLENKLHFIRKGEELNEVEETFICAIQFCQATKLTQDEFDFFVQVCYHYIQFLLRNDIRDSKFFDIFYSFLINNETDVFPIEMLGNIHEITSYTFGLVCCASKIKGNILFNDYTELVEQTLKFVENEHYSVDIDNLKCFMNSIFKDKRIATKYNHAIHSMFDNVRSRYSSTNCERLFVIAKTIVKHQKSTYLFTLWTFYENLKGKNVDREPLLRFLIKCLEDVALEKQIATVQMIFNKVRHSKRKTHIFTTSLPYIFHSTTVKNSAKQYIVENLIPLLLIDKLCNAEKLLAMLYEYRKTTAFDTDQYIIQVLLLRAHRANDSGSLLFIERVIEFLPVSMKERVVYLFTILPIEMWEDSFLPVIIALLTPKVKIWQPLFTLSHQFSSIGGELVAVTFAKLIDDNNKIHFQNFLAWLMKSHTKVKHTQIITGVITMFHTRRIKIPYYLAEKAVKYSGHNHLLEFFLEPDSIPTWRYLLPHDANDLIYGLYRPLLSTSQAAAIALTFMNEYEAAKKSYIQVGPPIFQAMKEINDHFIAMCNNDSIKSLLMPLTTINRTNSVLVLLEEAATSYITHKNEVNLDILDKVTEANLSTAIGKKYLSAFEKERLTIIQAMISAISGKPQLNPDISCLNHSFITLYQKFERLLKNMEPKPEVQIVGGNPVCLMMPSMRSQFVRVCGYTSRGMVAVGKEHIEEYFMKIDNKIKDNEMMAVDWRNFAAFAFNVFCAQPSSSLFATAYGAYFKLFDEKLNYPQFVIQEAAARIITLCRLAISKNDIELIQTVKSSSNVFTPQNGEQWRFWLPHIVELADAPWFFDLAYGLFTEMSYRSVLYARKNKSKNLEEVLKKLIHDHPSSQISMMEITENFFNSLFSLNFEEKQNQSLLLDFALECQKLKDVESIDLMSVRRQMATNSFQRSLKALTVKLIQMIGDFPTFANTVKNMTFEELSIYIQNLTQSKMNISEMRNIISKSTQTVNDNLPFIFPLRLEKKLQISILQIQDNFNILSPNMIIIKMVSSMYQWKHYIVQRTTTPGGYHKSVLTLANAMFLFKTMLQRQYSSRRRNLIIFPSQFFEIGCDMILIPVISEARTFEDFFRESMMMTSNEWLDRYVVKDEYTNQLVVTEEGRKSISTFPHNYFTQVLFNVLRESDLLKMRPLLANSVIVSCLMRHVFNAPYPHMDDLVVCQQSAVIPLMHSSYDYGQITDIKPRVDSSFRLSPNMVDVLGPSLDGSCIMTMAVFSKVMTKNIESVRSYIEAMIGDEDYENQRRRSLEDCIETRTAIESRFLNFCPPRVANVDVKTVEEWLDGVEKFVKRATNPEIQPVEAVPWF
ncbi:hypothetical protein TRFO_14055 [Tritrichomonas foetus]|uniref:Uncharacterized protein n=1 Tax=Tritrichomonas foetus TaxID=1144522 RepID=A0A1J4KX39_9EUKA|nr:hypothetical protein TRFO_14055 [Tritrichomonas foetus]|eukprot:OHT15448.1 hypothetical protein TRFO_14055 [Tritrichomonas foetus]